MSPNELFGKNQQANDYVTIEEMEAVFKTPTQMQSDYEPKPDPTANMDDLGRLADPTGTAFTDFEKLDDDPAPVDPEKAKRTGDRIARIIDTGIDFTLSNFVARNGESYKADERDLDDIAECWGEIAQEKGWSIGPEWSLVILYIMVYGPLVKQAFTDRRMAELESRMAAVEENQKTIMMHQEAAPQPQPKPQPQPEKPADHGNPEPAPSPKPSPFS